jgi:hypothetical protein
MSMNITLSVDEQTVARAREVARQQGTSLNALIRDYLERIAGQRSNADIYRGLERLWAEGVGASGGAKFRRADAYEERLGGAPSSPM